MHIKELPKKKNYNLIFKLQVKSSASASASYGRLHEGGCTMHVPNSWNGVSLDMFVLNLIRIKKKKTLKGIT